MTLTDKLIDRTEEWKSIILQNCPEYEFDDNRKTEITLFTNQATQLLSSTNVVLFELKSKFSDYVNSNEHLVSHSSTMTDEERDKIDKETTYFLATCGSGIEVMKKMTAGRPPDKDKREGSMYLHQHSMIERLYQRLEAIVSLLQLMKNHRLKYALAASQRFSELSEDIHNESVDVSKRTGKKKHQFVLTHDELLEEKRVESFVSTDDISLLQQELLEENHDLLAELQNELDCVRQFETKMVQISSLMSLFSSKVVEQQTEIEQISKDVVTASINVQEGNQYIDKASETQGSFRKAYIIFIMFLSFALLFLNWYVP